MSVWEVYAQNSGSMGAALPETQGEGDGEEAQDGAQDGKEKGKAIQSITLQLTLGILTIRLLSCGLLVMGMSDSTPSPSQPHTTSTGTAPAFSATALTPRGHTNPSSNQGSIRGKGKQIFGGPGSTTEADREGIRSSAASDAGSTGTVTGRGREVQAVRKGTEEAARWLEKELVGFKVGEGI